MKRLLFSIVLVCLSGMVFAVIYPTTPYKNTGIYTYSNGLVVPMEHQMRPAIKPVSVRFGAQPVAASGSSSMTVQTTSGGSRHSYGAGSATAGSVSGTHSVSAVASSPSVAALSAHHVTQDAKVRQLASTTYDSNDAESLPYRGDGPPIIDEPDPENPAIWIPVGDAFALLILLAILYATRIILKHNLTSSL